MCGILGLIHNSKFQISKEYFKEINKININRGPDNQDIYEYQIDNCTLKIGHTRLSIQDLSPKANQPMISSSGRFIISFNGEIYNHINLRKNLSNQKMFETTSDTETLLELFEHYEFEKTLSILEGMYSFLLLDKKDNKLYAARDITGEKPLYVGMLSDYIFFGSDLKTLIKIKGFNKEINKEALQQFLEYNYVPNPNTIFQNVFKIPPASFIQINLNKFKTTKINNFEDFNNLEGLKSKRYWNFNQNSNYSKINLKDAKIIIKDILKKSVKKQMISDVPVGAFLSGGIDSSLIVSLMSEIKEKVNTFTIGYENKLYDESIYADPIAQYLGTNHTNYIFSNNEVINFIKESNFVFSEPFADSSQLPTLLVSKIAKQNVKVVLTGDGGDELFGGYNRYIYAKKYWKNFRIIKYLLQSKFIKNLIMRSPDKLLDLINKISSLNINRLSLNKIFEKIELIDDELSYYSSMITEWRAKDNVLSYPFKNGLHTKIEKIFNKQNLSFQDKMMLSDFDTYLTDDILCKVDRSTMNYSLESRAPFLDKNLIELALNLPNNLKINNANSKVVIKNILNDYLPEKLFNRPKMGFGIPIGDLLRNELKNWSSDILSKEFCDKHSFFNYNVVKKTFDNHLNHNENNQFKLWSLIQFNLWYDNISN